jgi:hypothetical protein
MTTATRIVAPDSRILTARPAHLRFVRHLARLHANAVGFIPAAGLEKYLERGDVTLCLQNDDPAGYLLGRPAFRWQPLMTPITQAAVCFDAQRRHLGLALVDQLAAASQQRGQLALQAICRQGLDANAFWLAAGFEDVGHLHPWTARKKELIVWRKQLTHTRPLWFDFLPTHAGHKARRTA